MNIQQVQTIIADAMEKHNGIVKKEELTRLGIDYRRIDTLVQGGEACPHQKRLLHRPRG